MAERLTKKIVKTIQDKYSLGSYLYYDFNGIDDTNKLLNKLGKLEDILEEFNISSIDELHEFLCWEQEQRKELDKIYNVWEKYGCKTLQEVDDLLQGGCDTMCIMEENKKLETDRATWKRACELACEREDDCYVYDNIHRAYEFYQQAKKEGENNDTNN